MIAIEKERVETYVWAPSAIMVTGNAMTAILNSPTLSQMLAVILIIRYSGGGGVSSKEDFIKSCHNYSAFS
jgi:hypothetical protein